jgi:negative regulator of flagellin synthesis FlgM
MEFLGQVAMTVDFNGVNQNRVNDPQSSGVGKRADAGAKDIASPQQTTATTDKSGENVSLSAQARNLTQLEQTLKDLPTVDKKRVAEIKARIDNGTYQINSKNLAQKLLNLEK